MDLRELPSEPLRRHPWEVARQRFFSRLLVRAGALARRGLRLLDVGAGDAWFARRLIETVPGDFAVTCWDSGYAAPSEQGRLWLRPDQPTERFDVVLLLDVLEHVVDDADFLAGVVERNLAAGGLALVSVPAWGFLFGNHDRALLHHRRYAPSQLHRLTRQVGLVPLLQGGLFHALVFARLLQNLRDRLTRAPVLPPSTAWRGGEWSARLVEAVLGLENAASHLLARARIELPGLTTWMLCRRA